MKPRCTITRNHALTLLDVLAVIAILVIFAVLFIPAGSSSGNKSQKIVCTNHLKQIGMAERVWAGDHNGLYPQDVPVTNGGTKEIFSDVSRFQNLAFLDFLTLSNELAMPQILHCPSDTDGSAATNFSPSFCNQNVSYFVGLDSTKNSPQAFMSGDDNFEIGGAPVTGGLLALSSNVPIGWTAARHNHTGNILLGDGSVQSSTTSGLRSYLQQTGLATNRLVIP